MVACDIAFIRRILAEGGGLVAGPGEREMFERVAKLVKTGRMRPWRLDQAARSIFRRRPSPSRRDRGATTARGEPLVSTLT